MPLRILDPRYDGDQMVFPVSFDGQTYFEVRVPGSAMAQGNAWIKARIRGWFKYSSSIQIPDYQFYVNMRQAEG